MKYKIGDVVYAYVQHLDNGENAKRIVVVLGEKEAVEVKEFNDAQYEAFNVTAQKHENIKANIPLFKDKCNQLDKDSYVKMDRIYEINDRCIIEKYGALSEKDRERLLMEKDYFQEKGRQELQPLEKNLQSARYYSERLNQSRQRERG